LKFHDSDFELVILDNTDTLELKDYLLSKISDKRLIYNYTAPPFSSFDNFNAALDKSMKDVMNINIWEY
jgi:hypothetical protein